MVKVQRCIVDTENEFIFKGIKYKINKDLKQYKISDSGLDMDSIIILEREHENIVEFLDENDNVIEKKYINFS